LTLKDSTLLLKVLNNYLIVSLKTEKNLTSYDGFIEEHRSKWSFIDKRGKIDDPNEVHLLLQEFHTIFLVTVVRYLIAREPQVSDYDKADCHRQCLASMENILNRKQFLDDRFILVLNQIIDKLR